LVEIKNLLEKGADVNCRDEDDSTPLITAATLRYIEVARVLLKNGADVNAHQKTGVTPLMMASHLGHVEMVRALIENGAEVNRSDISGSTPLIEASDYGHVEVVKILLDNLADVNAYSRNRWSPLLAASSKGHSKVVKLLVKKGADINAHNKCGLTSLMIASHKGNVEFVRVLLDNGADTNTKSYRGSTAYSMATKKGHTEIVQLLKDHGAMTPKWSIILGTIRLVVISIILIVIAKIRRERSLTKPLFSGHQWTLNDAYKVLIPVLGVAYFELILRNTINQCGGFVALIRMVVYGTAIYVLYYMFIKKKYQINTTTFGLDEGKFLTSGVLNANIAIILAMLAILYFPEPVLPSVGGTSTLYGLPVYAGAIALLLIVLLGAVLEELLFRGVLYAPVARKTGPFIAVVLLSIVGGLGHLRYSGVEVLSVIIIFAFLYWIYIRSSSLYGPIIWHMTKNLVGSRHAIAPYLVGHLDSQTLDKYYICGLIITWITINLLWLWRKE
jgi:membrane protease YdiL (CAAX protease family)